MKSVLISIRPQWCEKIISGEKTIEVRKTAPKEVPFKAYIYATRPKKFYKCGAVSTSDELLWLANGKIEMGDGFNFWADGDEYQCLNGRIIGEFVCDKVFLLRPYTYDGGSADLGHRKFIQTFEGSSKGYEILSATCLSQDEMFDYICVGNYGYGWHISDLKIYDKPKELSEFYIPCKEKSCRECDAEREYDVCAVGRRKPITRPPQSYMFVEELK